MYARLGVGPCVVAGAYAAVIVSLVDRIRLVGVKVRILIGSRSSKEADDFEDQEYGCNLSQDAASVTITVRQRLVGGKTASQISCQEFKNTMQTPEQEHGHHRP